MFKSENRLKKDAEIKRVVKSGKSVFDAICGVKYINNGLEVSRFAVVVGLKVHKSAVKRNKIKRQYREIIQKYLNNIKPGFDIMFLTSKKALDIDFIEKEEGLLKILKKAALL